MSNKAFDLMLKLLEMRKERSAMASRQASYAFQRAKSFSNQIDEYAKEYDAFWLNSVQKGDVAMQLQVQAAFGDRLQATAREQRSELSVLEQESRLATQKALVEADRVKTMRAYLAKRRLKVLSEMDKRAQTALDDQLNVKKSVR